MVGGDYQGLGIVRSIGLQRAPVFVLDDERSIARHSRFATGAERVASLEQGDEIVEHLLGVAERHELAGWVLFPTRDEIVNAIAQHREELARVFRVPTPAWETVQWAADKRKTYELAVELGLPTPLTAWPRDETELAALDVTFPVAIKPAVKEVFIRVTRAKAWRADTRAELVDLFRRARSIVPDGQAMVQELIPGGGDRQFAFCTFFKDGETVASMQARRRRQHPWEFGRASTFVETVEPDELADYSARFLARLDYYGLAELEYKLDPRDGSYKLLDVNTRTWGYHTLGSAAGVDFTACVFRDQMGETVPRQQARPGVTWLRLLTDVPTAVADMTAHRLTLRHYLASLRRVDIEAVWDTSDPRPWLAELSLIPYLAARRGF